MSRTEERKQFLLDIFTTALEGGIGYWSQADTYRWSKRDENNKPTSVPDLDSFYAILNDAEAEEKGDAMEYGDGQVLWGVRVDADVIARGINLISAGGIFPNNKPLEDLIKAANAANDCCGPKGDIDAEGADVIVQAGLFGEVIFG